MLYSGAHYASRVRFTGGTAAGLGRGSTRDLCNTSWLDLARTFGGLNAKTSVPDGYRGGVALTMARSDGGMAGRLSGGGLFDTVDLTAIGVLTTDCTGSGAVNFANAAGGVNISCAASGNGAVAAADMRGFGRLTCTISIGAQPSADDIAQAVLNASVAGNTSSGNVAEALKKTLKRDEFLGLS